MDGGAELAGGWVETWENATAAPTRAPVLLASTTALPPMSSVDVFRVWPSRAPITALVLRSSTLMATPTPAPRPEAFTTAPAMFTITVLSRAVTRTSTLSMGADVMIVPLPICAVVSLVMSSTLIAPATPHEDAAAPENPMAMLSIDVSAATCRPP